MVQVHLCITCVTAHVPSSHALRQALAAEQSRHVIREAVGNQEAFVQSVTCGRRFQPGLGVLSFVTLNNTVLKIVACTRVPWQLLWQYWKGVGQLIL
jgi:hypothetical protein